MKYILASMSPRRKELLEEMGIEFEISPADIDENIGISDAPMLVKELSLLKGADVAKAHAGQNVLVISADTVVCLNGEILGKPKDDKDAERMLKSLSGNTHEVYTGFCVTYAKDGRATSRCAKTLVTFKKLSEKEISDYIKTKEPFDKAGAYGIQGQGGKFVEKIEGEFSNVVGLPKEDLGKLLRDEFTF